MSGRIFQNVVLQIKEATDRVVGVIDAEGAVISCSDLGLIGRKWPEYVETINQADGAITSMDGKTFRALSGWGSHFDYAVFTMGDDEISHTVCSMASVSLNGAKSYYEESTTGDPSLRTSSLIISCSATSTCGPRSSMWRRRCPGACS